MSRHHTDNQCYWRCPVSTCPLWFSSELNGKDHLERIHSFREGQGCSFYECLRSYGLEWFGKRSFFDQRECTGQAMWIDLSLARPEQSLHYHGPVSCFRVRGSCRDTGWRHHAGRLHQTIGPWLYWNSVS